MKDHNLPFYQTELLPTYKRTTMFNYRKLVAPARVERTYSDSKPDIMTVILQGNYMTFHKTFVFSLYHQYSTIALK